MYTVDLDVKTLLELEPRAHDFIFRLEPKLGLVEHISPEKTVSGDLISVVNECRRVNSDAAAGEHEPVVINGNGGGGRSKPRVAVVGGGPSGTRAGRKPTEIWPSSSSSSARRPAPAASSQIVSAAG